MDCILRSKSCLSDTCTLSSPYPTPSLPKGSLYPSTSAPEPLSGTPNHYSCLGLCLLQYLHSMSSQKIDTRSYSTSYQVDRTPSEFPILIWKFPALIWVVPTLSKSPLDALPELSASKVLQTLLGLYWTLSKIKGTILR
jgi:hypothetical protein